MYGHLNWIQYEPKNLPTWKGIRIDFFQLIRKPNCCKPTGLCPCLLTDELRTDSWSTCRPNISQLACLFSSGKQSLDWEAWSTTWEPGPSQKPCTETCKPSICNCSKAVLLLWIFYVFSVLCLLCLCAHLFICALWSPAGKGLTSWLSFVVNLSLSHWYRGSGVVLDCIDS